MVPFSKAYWVSLPGVFGRFIALTGFKLAHKLVKFN